MNPGKKIARRKFLSTMAATTVAGVVASCTPASATPVPAATQVPAAATQVPQATQAAAVVQPTATTAAQAAAPVVKYADKAAVHRYLAGGFAGAGPDDKLIKEIQEKAIRDEYGLNIDLQCESAPWSDVDTLITTRLETKGVDSVERGGSDALNWLSQEGLLQDEDAYLAQYGTNLTKMLPSAAFDYFKRGGKRWVFANFYATPVDCEYIHIRRDWLDKIGRDIPQTIEDLEECLTLFKEKKLGGDVTIPLANDLGGWLMQSYVLTGPFAPEPDEQKKMLDAGEDFEYEYGCAMRPARLELLQKWFVDGLINPEWATFKAEDTDSAIQKGYVGALLSGWWNLNSQLERIQTEVDKSQDWVQIYPPVGLKGKPNTNRILTEIPLERATVVTSWANAPEAIVAFADWQNKSWENYLLCNYGIEGKHWKFAENGAFVDLRKPAPNSEYSGMRRFTWAPQWNNKFNTLPAPPETPFLDPRIQELIYGPHIYNRPDTKVPRANEYATLSRIFHFVAWNWKNSSQFEPDLLALRGEWVTKIIKNEAKVTEGLKGFWDQWMAAGGDVRVQEIKEQYDAYAKAFPEMTDPKIFFSPENWNTEIKYPAKKS
jgi:hypothetical protein